MELIKLKSCQDCNHIGTDGECRTTLKNELKVKIFKFEQCKYFADKAQIESLIEEAEERHRNNWKEVICSCAEECENCESCGHSKPHVFGTIHREVCKPNMCEKDESCIAYRGNPEANEEEVKEYVVVKDMTYDTLADSDINGEIFKLFYSQKVDINFSSGFPIINPRSYLYINADELKRLGFIEEKVHDPIVSAGDSFKYVPDGTRYRIIMCGDGQYLLSALSGVSHWGGLKMLHTGIKLSDFVSKRDRKDFKPCKIKITEVKDGE